MSELINWCPVHVSTYGLTVFGSELLCSTALLADTEKPCIKQQGVFQVTPLPRPTRRHRKDWLASTVFWTIVLTGLYLIAQGVRLIL